MKKLIFILLLGINGLVQASETDLLGIDIKNRSLEKTATILIAADWYTTRKVLAQPGFEEQNAFLGKHPSPAKINKFFVGKLFLHFFINDKLPQLKNIWNIYEISITVDAVKGNYINMQMNF